jgi:hypothetical protein
MNTRNLVIAGMIVAVVSLVATQVFAMPNYFYRSGSPTGGSVATMGGAYGQMNGSASDMMNGQGMMGMMNGQSMSYQECQERMGPNASQMMNAQNHQEYCQQYMGPNHSMTAEQCQAMYEDHHT